MLVAFPSACLEPQQVQALNEPRMSLESRVVLYRVPYPSINDHVVGPPFSYPSVLDSHTLLLCPGSSPTLSSPFPFPFPLPFIPLVPFFLPNG